MAKRLQPALRQFERDPNTERLLELIHQPREMIVGKTHPELTRWVGQTVLDLAEDDDAVAKRGVAGYVREALSALVVMTTAAQASTGQTPAPAQLAAAWLATETPSVTNEAVAGLLERLRGRIVADGIAGDAVVDLLCSHRVATEEVPP